MGNGSFQRLAYVFREHIRIFDLFSVIAHRFNDRFHITDGNAFSKQICQHLLQAARADNAGDCVLHNARIGFFQVFQQVVDLLTVEKFVQMFFDYLRQMCDDYRSRIDQGIACHFRLYFPILADPFGRDVECRVYGVDSRDVIRIRAGRKRQEMIHEDISSCHFFSF